MVSIRKLLRDRRGAAAIELGLILALIVIAVFGALNGLGQETTKSFNSTAQQVQQATR